MKSYVTAFVSRPLEFGTFCGCFKLTFFLPGKPLITEPLITNYDPLLIKHPTKLSLAFLPLSHPLSTPVTRARPLRSLAYLSRAEPRWAEPKPPGESPGEGVSRQILTYFPGFRPRQVFAEIPLRTCQRASLSLPGRSRIPPHQASPTYDAREQPGCRRGS